MRTRLEVFQRLDSRFRGNDKQGGNDEGDALPLVPLSETRVNYAAGSSIPLVNQWGRPWVSRWNSTHRPGAPWSWWLSTTASPATC